MFVFLHFRWDIHILLVFFFSLSVETHRNKSLCSSKCPHSVLDGISNKATVSCKEYYISLIVLQIPFLIKIKIFIITTLLYSLQICVLSCLLGGWCSGYIFLFYLFIFFFREGAALVRKIYSNWFCLFVAAAIETPEQNQIVLVGHKHSGSWADSKFYNTDKARQ